jgi:hypothetical protein
MRESWKLRVRKDEGLQEDCALWVKSERLIEARRVSTKTNLHTREPQG